jgi:hypothetical protein
MSQRLRRHSRNLAKPCHDRSAWAEHVDEQPRRFRKFHVAVLDAGREAPRDQHALDGQPAAGGQPAVRRLRAAVAEGIGSGSASSRSTLGVVAGDSAAAIAVRGRLSS